MHVNTSRLWNRLQSLHEFGMDEKGGITRLSFTSTERRTKEQVAAYMREAGLLVREDAVGNLIGRRPGASDKATTILVGSHIDSVLQGGDFDGPLGVLSGIEALQVMNERGETLRHAVEVIAFTDEEGARFHYGMIGSRAIAGLLTEDVLTTRRDEHGVSIAEAMRQMGYDPTDVVSCRRPKESIYCYLEVHIEQGKRLESQNAPVGVVSGIAGPLWLKFSIYGEAGHAGTTAMQFRRDALGGAAEIVLEIERIARMYEGTVGTVGQMSVYPGGTNIIPGAVEFTLDLRHVDGKIRDQAEAEIRRLAGDISDRRHLVIEIDELQRIAPVDCSPRIREATRAILESLDIRGEELASGAGHDGMQFGGLWPIGMVFVRSKNGVSHHPDEWSSPEDCAAGAEVLYCLLKQVDESDGL